MAKLRVPSASSTADKWAEVTPGRQKFYATNAPAAASEWEANAKAASKTFIAGVTAGGVERRYSGGIAKAGAAKYARKVTDVGAGRFSSGVSAAKQDFQGGVDPFLAELGTIDVPARGIRGDPTNLQRVSKIATELNKKRLALLAAT